MDPFTITIKPDRDSDNKDVAWFNLTVDTPGQGYSPHIVFEELDEMPEGRKESNPLAQLAVRIDGLVPEGLISLYRRDRYALSLMRGVGFDWEPMLNGTVQAITEFYKINSDDVKVVGKTDFLIAAEELDAKRSAIEEAHIPTGAGVDVTG